MQVLSQQFSPKTLTASVLRMAAANHTQLKSPRDHDPVGLICALPGPDMNVLCSHTSLDQMLFPLVRDIVIWGHNYCRRVTHPPA